MFEVSLPSKAFLLGEYGVLLGLPAIVMTFAPRFKVTVNIGSRALLRQDCMMASPAGQLIAWSDQQGCFELKGEWIDPFQGRGGFGASTAQFLGVYWSYAQDKPALFKQDAFAAWQCYQQLFQGSGRRPSGADLMAQCLGGVIFFDPQHPDSPQRLTWPLSSLWVFTGTHQMGRKVATHQHLSQLSMESLESLWDMKSLFPQPKWQSLEHLGRTMNAFAEGLQQHGFELPQTTEDRQVLGSLEGVLGVKGAGALQADALLVLIDPESSLQQSQRVLQCAQQRGLILIAQGVSTEERGIVCHHSV